MNDDIRRVWEAAETREGEAIALLQDMIRVSAGGEPAIQDRVAAAYNAVGCKTDRLRYAPGDVPLVKEFAADRAMDLPDRESVLGRFTGSGGGRSLIFFAHPDGELVGGTETWHHDPFAGTIENGRLYGWGVADDLLGVAASVAAMAAITASGLKPAGDVLLASTPSKRHARGVAALLHHGVTADGAVYLHPAESGDGFQKVKAFAAGQVEFRVIVKGQLPDTREPGHTAFYHRAVNPVDKAFVVYQALMKLGAERAARVKHPALEAAIGRSTNLQVSAMLCGEDGRFSRLRTSCMLGAALSFPPSEDLLDIQREVEAAVAAAGRDDAWLRDNPPAVEWHSGVTGLEIPTDHPLYRVVADAVTDVTGIVPSVNPLHTSSDIRNPFVQKGIPTVGLGPLCGDLTQVGGHDEWVDVADYHRMVKIAAAVIVNWCGVNPA